MIKAKDLNIWVGNRKLLDQLNFVVNPGTKTALVGANGSGKTTLINTFKQTAAELELNFAGALSIEFDRKRIAWVEQEVPNTTESALQYVIQGDYEYAHWQQILEQALVAKDDAQIALANQKLDDINAWTIQSRAAIILVGLGFSQEQMQQPVNTLSGGWRIRLNLARALLVDSDLLLLDEPTNHLDIDAIYWLEDYLLKRYKGTIIFISHDQEFMDNLADHVLYISNQQIESYKANYSGAMQMRAERLANQQAAYAQQQKHIAQVEKFIERFRYKARKASQAQSRIKYLERLQRIDPVTTANPFSFSFQDGGRLPSVIATLRNASLGYLPGKPVLTGVNLSLLPGMNIGLLGLNGAGKSTLIKALARELTPLDQVGSIEVNDLATLGYFNQYVIDKLDVSASPMVLLQRLDPKISEAEARKFLGSFNFTGDKVFEQIDKFSGGEKSRLSLALIIYQKPNFLLLDEPTNHLDLEMRQALANALQEFNGTLIVVSHDRFLLQAVVEQFYLVHEGKVREFPGNLDDYYKWILEQKAEANLKAAETAAQDKSLNQAQASDNEQKTREQFFTDTRLVKELNRKLLPLKQKQRKLEEQAEKLSSLKQQLENQFLDPEVSADGEKVVQLSAQLQEVNKSLASNEEAWLEIEMEIEEISEEFILESGYQ